MAELFNEALFPAVKPVIYDKCVAEGYALMKTKSVTILGLARDIAPVLPLTIQRIEHLGSLFRTYEVVIYENDSVDDTRKILDNWNNVNFGFHAINNHRPRLNGRSLTRAAHLAEYREQLRKAWLLRPTDYVIVVDLDLPGGFSFDGIAHSFSFEWDFVGSNGLRKRQGRWEYADVWAFRKHDHWEPHKAPEINPMVYKRGENLLRVFSCFGGLGIYTGQAYALGKYSGEDCEHVCFHRSLQAAGHGRFYMNPSQITLY